MSKLLSHSDYWCLQAQEARLAAQRIEDPEPRQTCSPRRLNMGRLVACNREWETRLSTAGLSALLPIATAKSDIRDAKDKCALRSGPIAALDWRMQAYCGAWQASSAGLIRF
jgi:hypothetical protein